MQLISNIQISGPMARNFLISLGLQGITTNVNEYMLPGTRLGTIHQLTRVLEETTAFPANRDPLNSLMIWGGGFVDIIVNAAERRSFDIALWKEFYEAYTEALGNTVVKHVAALGDCQEYQAKVDAAVEYLSLWGGDVHLFGSFAEPAAKELVLGWFRRGETVGIAHTIENDRIRLGTAI